MPRPPDLPDYERPPIDEVAIGVQFSPPIQGFADAHTGLFWQRVKPAYPKAETQVRIESQPEVFDQPPGVISMLPQQFFATPQGARTFLISEDDAYLLQIQNTRFYRNWRRRSDPYPHFDDLERDFRSDLTAFRKFLAAEGLPSPVIRQIDVTYINWIPDMPATDFLRPGAPVTVDVTGLDHLPEDQTWIARYLVRGAGGQPTGRLHVQCVPAVRAADAGPVQGAQMSLVFLVPCAEPPSDDALERILADGRDAIVRGFTELTTAVAHEHWGRVQ